MRTFTAGVKSCECGANAFVCNRCGEIEEARLEQGEHLGRVIEQLKAENERLKKQVEEYRLAAKAWNKECLELKKRVDYLEGYIKMIKDNEVDDVIGEVE